MGNDPLNRFDVRGLLASRSGHPGLSPYYQVNYNKYFGDFNSSWDSIYGPANGTIPYYSGSTISFLSNNPGYIKRSTKIKRVWVKDEVVEESAKLVWKNGKPEIEVKWSAPTEHLEYRVEEGYIGGDGLESGLSFFLTIGGLYSGINEFSKVRFGRWFSPATGIWYKMGYYGRTDLTLQSEVLLSAKSFRFAGRVFGGVAIVTSLYQLSYQIKHGTNQQIAKAELDVAMSVISFMGPVGLGISSAYFLIDTTVGWDSFINTTESAIEKNKQILGNSWRPWR